MNKGRVVMAIELPYANLVRENSTIIGSLNWDLIAHDSAVELAVAMINNNTEILPDHFVEIVRVNNFDPNPDVTIDNSGGFALNQVYEFMSDFSDKDIILAQGDPDYITLSSDRLWSFYNVPYCGYSQWSFKYDDPQYSKFFSFYARKNAQSIIIPLLRSFKATRVAIIHASSEGSSSTGWYSLHFIFRAHLLLSFR